MRFYFLNESERETRKELEASLKLIKEQNSILNFISENAITARIGGDEFVSFIISDEEDFESSVKQKIKQRSEVFNQNCGEPYYIELSVGVHKCICNASIEITDLLQKSDVLLYEEKKQRRNTIRK